MINFILIQFFLYYLQLFSAPVYHYLKMDKSFFLGMELLPLIMVQLLHTAVTQGMCLLEVVTLWGCVEVMNLYAILWGCAVVMVQAQSGSGMERTLFAQLKVVD